MEFVILQKSNYKSMSYKKVVLKPTPPKNVVVDDSEDPLAFYTRKGVQYPRPKHFAVTPAGIMDWVYDVDNYPDSK
jgi:hypothetical protein